MPQDLIRYDLLVQDALKGVVRKVLTDTAAHGIAGDHHFYISFRTGEPGVRISQRLREKWPEEMTIILQHQFWDLGVTEHAFEVGLSFSGIPERLLIPFDALTGFFDPSVQFGLKFEVATTAAGASEGEEAQKPSGANGKAEAGDAAPPAQAKERAAPRHRPRDGDAKTRPEAAREAAPPDAKPDPDASEAGAAIVSLDAFRKKS